MVVLVGAALLVWRGHDARDDAHVTRQQAKSVTANADALHAQLRSLQDRVDAQLRQAAALTRQTDALVAARRAVTDAYRTYVREAVATTNAQTARIAALNGAVAAANVGNGAGKHAILTGEVAQAEARAVTALARQEQARTHLESALTKLGELAA